jgi:hypothetical protein
MDMNTIASNTHKFAAFLQEQAAGAYTCNEPGCGRHYTRASETLAHIDWHNEDWKNICEGCELRFKYMRDLCKHKVTHHGEKPY